MKIIIKLYEKNYEVEVEKVGDELSFFLNGKKYKAQIKESAPGLFSILFEDGKQREILANKISENSFNLYINAKEYPVSIFDALSIYKEKLKREEKKSSGWVIKAQIPGKIVKILKKEGEEVQKEQGILVMEAMKMQNELKAPDYGKIKKIYVKEMQAIEAGAVLVEAE